MGNQDQIAKNDVAAEKDSDLHLDENMIDGLRIRRKEALGQIEWHLMWGKDRKVQRRDLVEIMGIATATATHLLRDIKIIHGDDLILSGKGYIPGKNFAPKMNPAARNADQFLSRLHYTSLSGGDAKEIAADDIQTIVVEGYLSEHVDTPILQSVLVAMREKKAIVFDYVGLARGEMLNLRRVDPVALVYVHGRWHLRAYDHDRFEFRDFILSRIVKIHEMVKASEYAEKAQRVSEMVDIRLALHPALTIDQRQVATKAYGIDESGVLTVTVPRVVEYYLLDSLRLTPRYGDIGPPEQMFVLAGNQTATAEDPAAETNQTS